MYTFWLESMEFIFYYYYDYCIFKGMISSFFPEKYTYITSLEGKVLHISPIAREKYHYSLK